MDNNPPPLPGSTWNTESRSIRTVSHSFEFLFIMEMVIKLMYLLPSFAWSILGVSYLVKEQRCKLSITCKCWVSAALLWALIASTFLKFLTPGPVNIPSALIWNFIHLLDCGFISGLSIYTIWLLAKQPARPPWWFGETTVYNVLSVLSGVIPAALLSVVCAFFHIAFLFLNVLFSLIFLSLLVTTLILYNVKKTRTTSIRDNFPEKYLLVLAVCLCVISHASYYLVEMWLPFFPVPFYISWDFRWIFMFAISEFLQFIGCQCCTKNDKEGAILSTPSANCQPTSSPPCGSDGELDLDEYQQV